MKSLNELENVSKIKRENLDEKSYLKTLIEEAYKSQMINNEDIKNMQIQIFELLDERVYKYNGTESSSIRKEIMEQINTSNYYTISLYLKTFKSPDDAVNMLKTKGLKEAYYSGIKRIDRLLNIIKVMYIKVKQNKLKTKNTTYNNTILGGIQGFLKIYDPDFNAQDMKITADYPLYNNLIGKQEGVEFINKYVNSLYIENQFCNLFPSENIEHLLNGYSPEYEDLVINIFEIVLLEAIACKLVGRDIKDLELNECEFRQICDMFNGKSKVEIQAHIENAYKEFQEELFPQNKELQKYIEKNLKTIVDIMANFTSNSMNFS